MNERCQSEEWGSGGKELIEDRKGKLKNRKTVGVRGNLSRVKELTGACDSEPPSWRRSNACRSAWGPGTRSNGAAGWRRSEAGGRGPWKRKDRCKDASDEIRKIFSKRKRLMRGRGKWKGVSGEVVKIWSIWKCYRARERKATDGRGWMKDWGWVQAGDEVNEGKKTATDGCERELKLVIKGGNVREN